MVWTIEPLVGKYYGTRVTNGEDEIVVWTSFSTPVSEREVEAGWRDDDGYDHVESQKDYEYALAIRDALNKTEKQDAWLAFYDIKENK